MIHPCFRHNSLKDIDPRDVYVSMRTSVCTYLFTCWDMTHSCLRHNSLKEICPTSRFAYLYAHICSHVETWLIHVSDMTHQKKSALRLDAHICMHVCIHLPRYGSFICETWFETWLTRIWNMNRFTSVRLSLRVDINESWLTYEWVMSPMCMNFVSRINESCLTYELGVMPYVFSNIKIWGGYD